MRCGNSEKKAVATLQIHSPEIPLEGPCLEDHPRTRKWLITTVNKSPKDRVVGPLPNGLFMAYKWGLLTTY